MAGTFQEKQLGQATPANTTAVSIYSPASLTTGVAKSLIVCNTSAASAKFRFFADADGTTYDESTAIFWDVEVFIGDSIQRDMHS